MTFTPFGRDSLALGGSALDAAVLHTFYADERSARCGGPSRTRSWSALAEIFKKDEKLGIWRGWPIRPNRSF